MKNSVVHERYNAIIALQNILGSSGDSWLSSNEIEDCDDIFALHGILAPLSPALEWRYDPKWQVRMTMPDGGLFSTPMDIALFANSFLNKGKGILTEDSVKTMLTEQSAGYSLGWILDKENQFSHWGSSGTLVWADQKSGVVGVFFSQIQDFELLAGLRTRFRNAVDEGFASSSKATK